LIKSAAILLLLCDIVLKNAGVKEKDTTYLAVHPDHDDGYDDNDYDDGYDD